MITLLFTNDVHSALDMWPLVAARIRGQQIDANQHGDDFLYVDSGDHVDRSNHIVEATNGALNIALLNAIGCRAATWGNSELINMSPANPSQFARDAHFPIVLSNVESPEEIGLTRSTVLPLGRWRVGLFGLTTEYNQLYSCQPMVHRSTRLLWKSSHSTQP